MLLNRHGAKYSFCHVTDNKSSFQWRTPITQELSSLAKELAIVIIAPFFERRAAGIYHNSLAVIDADGTLLGTYRKKHIPDDPNFHEKYYFTPGEDDYQVFETRYAKIGPLICWDQWYPEAARITALKGAELLVYPTAIGTLPAVPPEYQAEMGNRLDRRHALPSGHSPFFATPVRLAELLMEIAEERP